VRVAEEERGGAELVGEADAETVSCEGGSDDLAEGLIVDGEGWRRTGEGDGRVDGGAPCSDPVASLSGVGLMISFRSWPVG